MMGPIERACAIHAAKLIARGRRAESEVWAWLWSAARELDI